MTCNSMQSSEHLFLLSVAQNFNGQKSLESTRAVLAGFGGAIRFFSTENSVSLLQRTANDSACKNINETRPECFVKIEEKSGQFRGD